MKRTSTRFTKLWRQSLTDYITRVVWSPDGKALAVSSAAGEVVLFIQQQPLSLQKSSGEAVSTLGFSADGNWLAASGQKGEVIVWDIGSVETILADPSVTASLPVLFTQTHGNVWIDQLAWHPHRNHLAYSVGDQIYIWDIDTLSPLGQLDFQSSSVLHLAWHPEGTWLAASGHGGLKVWSSNDWSAPPEVVEVPGASLYTAWSCNGQYLGSGNLDRTLTVAEWQSPPPWLMQGFPGKVRQLAWAQNASVAMPLLAAACAEGITVWKKGESTEGWQSRVLQHHQGRVEAIAFQPDSLLLASVGQDGQICFWEHGRKLLQAHQAHAEGGTDLAWHPTGQLLATGSTQGQLTVWQQSGHSKGFAP